MGNDLLVVAGENSLKSSDILFILSDQFNPLDKEGKSFETLQKFNKERISQVYKDAKLEGDQILSVKKHIFEKAY